MHLQTVEELLHAIREIGREPVLAALDGRCASGKTTLAGELENRFGWSVVHMDDFFLRPEQRTPERYAAPGENIDHERFLREVLLPLHMGKSVSFRPFDCKAQRLSDEVKTVQPKHVVLIEGAYACHSALWDSYDLRVFLTVDPEEQARRIRRRNGEAGFAVFREKWIPLEEKYFAAFSVEQRCDIHLDPAAVRDFRADPGRNRGE